MPPVAGELCMSRSYNIPQSFTLRLNQQQVKEMLYEWILLDGRRGGLVLGPSHEEGNIFLLCEQQAGKYKILGTMEGGEYLLSHEAYRTFKDRIDEINSWEYPTAFPEKIVISEKTRIINAFGKFSEKVILIDRRGQFIVNKFATGKFLTELEDLNTRQDNSPVSFSGDDSA